MRMKKKAVVLIMCVALGVTGCTYKGQPKNQTDNAINIAETGITVGIEQEKFAVPYTVTKVAEDLNKDGSDEYIQVVLTEGEALENNQYKGKYAINLTDKEGQVLQALKIDDYKDITLPKDFDIIFKDYNDDGILDFNIGYENKDKAYYYKFYTLKETGELSQMGFMDYYWLKSCYTGNSYPFSVMDNQLVSYYKVDDKYYYESYKWEKEGYYGRGNQLVSTIDYDAIDKIDIQQHIRQLKEEINLDMTKKEFLHKKSDRVAWFWEHLEEWDIYKFMNEISQDDDAFVQKALGFNDDIEDVNWRFLENGKSIQSMSLDEFRYESSNMYFDDYNTSPMFKIEEHPWKSDKDYTLISGICHLTKFMLVYDDQGNYISGYTWSDNRGEAPVLVYREKQNAYSVTPVCFVRGTGTSLYGGTWFQLYKGRLFRNLNYATRGYESPPLYSGFTHAYNLIDEAYDQETGDYRLTYEVGIKVGDEEANISTENTIAYKWDDEKQEFDVNKNYDIYDTLKELFDEGVEDDIYLENKTYINHIIREKGNDYLKEELVTLLAACKESSKRDELLIILRTWCEEQGEHKEYYSKLIEVIDKTLKR